MNFLSIVETLMSYWNIKFFTSMRNKVFISSSRQKSLVIKKLILNMYLNIKLGTEP